MKGDIIGMIINIVTLLLPLYPSWWSSSSLLVLSFYRLSNVSYLGNAVFSCHRRNTHARTRARAHTHTHTHTHTQIHFKHRFISWPTYILQTFATVASAASVHTYTCTFKNLFAHYVGIRVSHHKTISKYNRRCCTYCHFYHIING